MSTAPPPPGPDPRPRYCAGCLTTFQGDEDRCPNLSCRRRKPNSGWGSLLQTGDVFDRHYAILDLLAMGGAGVTYLSQEVGADGQPMGPKLAIKVLFADRDHGAYLRRLSTEAQILQELDHPNIVQCMGFVHRAGHSPYLVTRFEAGGSLLDHLKRVGILKVRRAAQIARQVCWALEKAHQRGVVHRDLKPENVLLAAECRADEDPVVRVADFGIAKVAGGLGTGLTRVGAFVGTPHYAAPEQFRGETATAATDVYAVGALVYFCCTAKTVINFANRLEPDEAYQLLVDALPPRLDGKNDEPDAVSRLNRALAHAMAERAENRCTVSELDGWLGAIVADTEPDIPDVRDRPVDEDTMDHSLSDPGLATELGGRTAAAKPPPAAPASDSGMATELGRGPEWKRPSDVPRGTTPAVPESSASIDPTTEVADRPDEPPARSGLGRGLLLLVAAVLAFGGIVIVGAAAVWAWSEYGGDAATQELPIELTGRETNAAMKKDYQGLVSSVDALGPQLAKKCGAQGHGTLAVETVVERTGDVRSVAILDSAVDDADRCIAAGFEDVRLQRSGARPVRVRLTLKW